jgi:hypothetical protein
MCTFLKFALILAKATNKEFLLMTLNYSTQFQTSRHLIKSFLIFFIFLRKELSWSHQFEFFCLTIFLILQNQAMSQLTTPVILVITLMEASLLVF